MAFRVLQCLPIATFSYAMVLLATFPTPAFAECPELIENGSFASDSVPPWTIEAIPPSPLLAISFFNGMRVSIPDPEFGNYTVEVSQAVRIRKGEIYRLSFFVQSPPAGRAHVRIGHAVRRTQTYGLDRDLSPFDGTMTGTDWATYPMTFVATDTDARAKFVISAANAESYNLFVRLTGVSLTQVTGDCLDGSPEEEELPDAGPADHPDAVGSDPKGSARAPRFATAGCAFVGGAGTRDGNGVVSVLFLLLLLGWVRRFVLRRANTPL